MALFDTIRAGASGATDDYEVERSLRFNSADSAHLSRTISSDGNRRLWTWSGWLKMGKQPSGQRFIFSQRTSSSNQCNIQYSENGRFRFESGGGKGNAFTQGQFRDPTAWYHLIVTLDSDNSTADDRIIFYVNGERQGLDISPAISTGDHGINNNNAQVLGRQADQNDLEYDGYMAEIHFIDGARKAPSDFAETDAVTGEYKPIKYTGTYGTQGWYYNFSDNSNTTASTLGKDYSGNSNNTTPGNMNVTANSVANDCVLDSPTNNWCTLNPLARFQGQPPEDGNLRFFGQGGGDGSVVGTHILKAGKKYYIEFEYTETGSGCQCPVGISAQLFQNEFIKGGSTTGMFAFDFRGGAGTPGAKDEGSVTNMGSRPSSGQICGIAVDLSGGKMYAHKGNSYYNSGNPDSGSGAVITGIPTDQDFHFHVSVDAGGGGNESFYRFNFGQQGFQHQPSSFTDLLNGQNLAEPTVPIGSEYFNTLLWTGTNAALTRDITGLDFSPDWVWIKSRSNDSYGGGLAYHHIVWDTVRGAGSSSSSGSGKDLVISLGTSRGEGSTNNVFSGFYGHVSSFNSDGFTVQKKSGEPPIYTDTSGSNYVAWCWDAGSSTVTNSDGSISAQVRANPSAGFSICTWTGTGSNLTIGHGLGVKPTAHITTSRTGGSVGCDWFVYLSVFGAEKNLRLNNTSALGDTANLYNDTEPTSSLITIGNSSCINSNGGTYVTYVFAEVEGYSSFGKYKGNGNTDGTFVFTGFRPAWVMVKNRENTYSWDINDSKRDIDNVCEKVLAANLTDSEATATSMDFVSNGFKLRVNNNSQNRSGDEFAYFAFAENPFKYARAR